MSVNAEYGRLLDLVAVRPSWARRGQHAFNVVYENHPQIANLLRGGGNDPFYLDDRLPAFWDAVRALLIDGVGGARPVSVNAEYESAIWDARPLNEQLREACSAVLTGAISGGFDGPQGLSITEAMDYACKLAVWVTSVLDKAGGDG